MANYSIPKAKVERAMLTVMMCIWVFATVAFLIATAIGWIDDPRDIIFSLIILAFFLVGLLLAIKDAKVRSSTVDDTITEDPE